MHRQTQFIPTLLFVSLTFIFQATANDLPEWKLVYQNNFEKKCDWISYNSQLSIKNGWLHIKATSIEGLAFAPGEYPENVRFEFDAQIDPADWAGEMTPVLAANLVFGWYGGYRLSFAAAQNTKCYISGPRKNSPVLTEYPNPSSGEVLHFVAEKIGRKVRLFVNDACLLEFEHPEYVGGPGRNRVGVMTRIGAILMDNVRIFTAPFGRAPTAGPIFSKQASPQLLRCDSLLLAGNFTRALDLLPTIPDAETRISILIELVNNLTLNAGTTAPLLLRELKNLGENQRDSLLTAQTEKLALLTNPATDFKLRAHLALALLYDCTRFSAQAQLLAAKTAYWGAQEFHFPGYQTFADSLFRGLREKNPDNALIKMYLGEKIIWEPDLISESAGPRWACLLREYYVRALKIIECWVTERQAATGALGGGWGDDVEILRQWNPVVAIASNNGIALEGIHRLVDGVWRQGDIDTLHGFSAKLTDVEHSAEPSADSQPPMLLLAPNNPVYFERNFAAVRQMRDCWTGIAPDGFRRFRSNTFSATEIVATPPFAVDVPYAHRAARHASWLLGQAKYPAVEKLVCEWAESWLAACLSEANGKPRGVAPAAIRFKNGQIGGYGPTWWEPNLGYNYYHWHVGNNGWILQLLNLAFKITGEKRFLAPLKIGLELSLRESVSDPVPGSADWVAAQFSRARFVLARAAQDSELPEFNAYVRRFASPAVRFRLTGDDRPLCETVETALAQLRFNWPLHTTEILATDRAYLPAVEDVFQAYTGANAGWSEFTPADPAVRWEVPTRNFAALVRKNNRQEFHASLFQFEDQPVRFVANFLRLEPGTYQMSLARDRDGDHQGEEIFETRKIHFRQSGPPIEFEVPGRTAVVLQMQQIQSVPVPQVPTPRLVLWQEKEAVWLYNLGSGAARRVLVIFWGAEEKIIQRQKISEITGVIDLLPIKIKLNPPPGTQKVQVRLKNADEPEENIWLKLNE